MTIEDDNIRDQMIERRGKGSTGDTQQQINKRGEDPRFSKLLGWAWAAIGSVALWVVVRASDEFSKMGDDISTIKLTLAVRSEKDAQLDAHLAATDRVVERNVDQIDMVKSRVSVLEGKNYRGPAENGRRGP